MTLTATIGGASSDTYGELAEWATYATAMGWTLTGTDPVKEAYLRRAAVALDIGYHFIGTTQYQTQARAWPRIDCGYVDGWPIDPDTIPQAVINAQFELAYVIMGGSDPLETFDGTIGSEASAVGPISESFTYLGGKSRPRFTAVDRLLRDYVTSGSGQSRMVRG